MRIATVRYCASCWPRRARGSIRRKRRPPWASEADMGPHGHPRVRALLLGHECRVGDRRCGRRRAQCGVTTPIEFVTPRLRSRQWCDADREPFAALNADPAVMEFFPALIGREASDASIDAWQSQLRTRGWSNWAVEVRATSAFIGFVGLSVPRRVLPFSPCVEIGWRLARAHWGQGFATEAARGALRVAFDQLALPEIVSFTTLLNLRSR